MWLLLLFSVLTWLLSLHPDPFPTYDSSIGHPSFCTYFAIFCKLFLPGLRMPFCFSREKCSYIERRFFPKKRKEKREKIPQKGFMYCSYPWERCTLPETAFYWAKLLCWYFMSYQNNLLHLSRSECRMVLSPTAKLFQIEPCPGIEKAPSCGKSCTTLWLIQHASLCLIKRWTLLGFYCFSIRKNFWFSSWVFFVQTWKINRF